jgi:uncharacterized protein with PQ loop repeat
LTTCCVSYILSKSKEAPWRKTISISIEWLGFAGIALCILGYLPQVIHLIKDRCSAGLSAGAYCTWGISAMLLLAYAISRRDLVFIALQTYNVGATALIYYLCRKYKGHLCELHGGEPSA